MSEADEQIAFIDYCDLIGVPCFAIPNGGSRNKIEAKNLKRQGVRSGVPDIMIPVARNGCHGLFIELKYGKNKATENQNKWINLLLKEGYAAGVCHGFDAAKNVLDKYLGL